MKKIYIDCTHTYNSGDFRGIPRVVRNIIHFSGNMGNECVTLPVVVKNDRYRLLEQNELNVSRATQLDTSSPYYLYVNNLYMISMQWICALLPFRVVEQFFLSSVDKPGFARLVSNCFLKPIRYLKRRVSTSQKRAGYLSVDFKAGDILFMPDCVWSYDATKAFLEAKNQGVKTVFFCHDIIPITHPNWCLATAESFKCWLDEWINRFDIVLANSNTTLNTLIKYLELTGLADKEKIEHWSSTPLGADIARANENEAEVSNEVSLLIGRHYFLAVSAIEPRKNHKMLLTAFELLWQAGMQVTLVWVGKWTWYSENLRRYVMEHQELGKRLFVFNSVSDADLVALYNNADSLVFSSIVEGFGLPIVEALNLQLPVLLSDTPIHREVAGEQALYFQSDDVLDLAGLVKAVINGEKDLIKPLVEPLSWAVAVQSMMAKLKGV